MSILYDECFPLVQKKNCKRKRHPWISNGILTSIKTKNKLLKISLKQPSDVKKSNYRSYRNKLNHVVRIAKKKHFSLKFKELQHDPKGTWSVINNLLNKGGNKSSISYCFIDDDNIVNDPIANAFNDYFVNIGPSLAKNIHSHSSANEYLGAANKCSMFFFPVTPDEIIKISSHCIKVYKAAGFDNLKPSIIKDVIHSVASPLTHIFNISLSTGVFPNKMKLAKIIPVYKKGEVKKVITVQYLCDLAYLNC